MEKAAAYCAALLDDGYCCAEALLAAAAKELGQEADYIPMIASGLCAGIARSSGPCGALTAAILALGLANGREIPEDGLDPVFTPAAELIREFERRFGATSCTDLLGCDLGTEEGRKTSAAEDLKNKKCRVYTLECLDMALKRIQAYDER